MSSLRVLSLSRTPKLIAWLAALAPAAAYLSVVSAAEMLKGAALLTQGQRRLILEKIIATHVLPAFEGRMLPLVLAVSYRIAQVTASARAVGNDIDLPDAAIAATALVFGYALATRNTRGFLGTGVKLVNPWLKL